MQHDVERSEPGRAAYGARFAHARPRDVEPWDSLTPEVKAIWARVERASQAQGHAGFSGCGVRMVCGSSSDIDLVKRWCEQAATIPMLQERIRETQKGLATAQQEAARWGSEYADAMDARMADAAHIETLHVALTVLAECKIGSGLAAVRKWFADGAQGPIPWPEGTLFATWAARHEIYDCNGAMGFRRGDRGRAA